MFFPSNLEPQLSYTQTVVGSLPSRSQNLQERFAAFVAWCVSWRPACASYNEGEGSPSLSQDCQEEHDTEFTLGNEVTIFGQNTMDCY